MHRVNRTRFLRRAAFWWRHPARPTRYMRCGAGLVTPQASSDEGRPTCLMDVTAAVRGLDRSSRWELVGQHPLSFPTHHPQGLAFGDGRTFVSSVEITEQPRRAADPAQRS